MCSEVVSKQPRAAGPSVLRTEHLDRNLRRVGVGRDAVLVEVVGSFLHLHVAGKRGDHRDLHSFPTRRSSDLDVEVEEAAQYLYEHGIPAYAYSTELPVEVLGAKYKWARGAGLL